jgi:hypothetical protein
MTMFDAQQAWFMLGCIARLGVALVLVLAAMHSMRDWPGYNAIVVNYRILPRPLGIAAAWVLPPLELLAAALLLIAAPIGALLGLALMAAFTGAVAINVWRGRTHIDCGCGGAEGQRLSWALVLRNALLMLLLAGAFAAPDGGGLNAATIIGIGGSTFFLVGTYFAANQLLTNQQKFGRPA